MWGPDVWRTLDYVGLTYHPPTQRESMKRFVESLVDVIPCGGCALHARVYLRDHPVALDTNEAFRRWLLAFHNSVNERKKETAPVVEWEQYNSIIADRIRDRIAQLRGPNAAAAKEAQEDEKNGDEKKLTGSSSETWLLALVGGLGLLLFAIYLFYRKKTTR